MPTSPARLLPCFALLLLLGTASSSAQVAASPTPVDPKRLAMGATRFKAVAILGQDSMPNGTVIDEMKIDAGRIRRIYHSHDSILGLHVDTITVNAATLRPVSLRSHSEVQTVLFDVKGDSVTGWRREFGDSATAPIRGSAKGLFYDGWSFDLLIRSADLRDGFEFVFPIMRDDPRNIVTMSGKVTGSAMINGMDCWVVEAKFVTMPVTFWIDKKTRALQQQITEPVPGMKMMLVAEK